MTDEEILYNHHLANTTKRRDEAIELLKKRNFKLLNLHYSHWYNKKEKSVKLKSTAISDVIKELSNIEYKENESEPIILCYCENEGSSFGSEAESYIEILSYIYTIVPFEKCESLARNYANSSLWKLKHQSKGKDAEFYREILNKHNRF